MALCLLVALTPLTFAAPLFEPYVGAKEVLIQAGTATAALLWILTARKESWILTLTPAWIPVLGVAVVGAASVLWSSNPSVSLEEGQRLVTYMLLFAVSLHAMRRNESRAMLATALVLAGAIEAVYALLQYTLGDPIFLTGRLPGKWQTFGTLGNPNWTGEFLAVTALVCLGRLIDLKTFTQRRKDRKEPRDNPKRRRRSALPAHSKRVQNLTLSALILMLLALAATLARGAWMAFIVGAVAFLILRRQFNLEFRVSGLNAKGAKGVRSPTVREGDLPLAHARASDTKALRSLRNTLRPLRLNHLPLATIAVAGILLIVLPLLTKREAIGHLLNLKSLRGRIWMWVVTGTMIRDAPWRGHGLGTFGLKFPLYQARAFSREWAAPFIPNASFTSYAHNDYLQLWAELGLVGLLAFGALIWLVLKRGRALAGDPLILGCWAAVISILVNAAVAFPLHLPTTLMLFVVLVAAVEASVSKKIVDLSKSGVPARIAIVLLLLILCSLAYRSSYNVLVAEAALFQADAALESRQWSAAERSIRTAIRHAPTRPEGEAMLGHLHFERGEDQDALIALDQAMKLGFDVDVYEMRTTALERTGQRGAAIAALNELVWLRPDLTWPRERLSAMKAADADLEDTRR